MTSKFSIKSFFPLLCIIPLIFGLTVYSLFAFDRNKVPPPLHGIPLILLLTFTIAWLFFGEFRTKMIKVTLEEDYIIIKQFGGLVKGEKFLYSDLDGFKISILSSQGGDNEYLYFMKDNKKVGKLSNFYHKNYQALKSNIKTKLDNLGFENFSYIDELKESFT